MSYVIGFDLGTHQTKICVQDASNPAEKTYSFFEFEMPNGKESVLFPSIVQINKDHTVSYGYADDNFLVHGGTTEPCPQLQLLDENLSIELPVFVKPTKYPAKPKFDPWMDNLRRLKGEKTEVDKWEETCNQIDTNAHKAWMKECEDIRAKHNEAVRSIKKQNEALRKDYTVKLAQWQESSVKTNLIFRYFKLHALTGKGVWKFKNIRSEDVCVWYIGYILLLLHEKYGDDFSVQFGVPCGASNTHRDRVITRKAYQIFIAAYDLIQNFSSVDDYISAKYEDLLQLTHYKRITEDLINQYYFDDIPEAFAGLVAVTLQRKLGSGFHLLVDIGGGTTDLALFCISHNHVPDVLYVTSFAYGINGILENTSLLSNKSIELLQREFLLNCRASHFAKPIKLYKKALKEEGLSVIKCIEKSFIDSHYHHGRYLSELRDALKYQPVIYAGGGGSFKELHTAIDTFSDIRMINKSMLSIKNLLTKGIDDKMFTILSTSYGLASFEKSFDEGIRCTDIAVAFQTFLPQKSHSNNTYDRYEHGLSDY